MAAPQKRRTGVKRSRPVKSQTVRQKEVYDQTLEALVDMVYMITVTERRTDLLVHPNRIIRELSHGFYAAARIQPLEESSGE